MMATNDKESSAAGMDNRPPMLEESDFESWKIRIERYIRGEQQTQVTREKTDEEFTKAENNKERADIQATNILSQILVHQRNTKCVNNLPSYWGKYVTIVKNSNDISIVSYVDLYTYLKSYEQHAMKTLSKMNQTSGNADPLYAHAPPQAPQSTNDAMLATMNQVVNLLSGFQKHFLPTSNQPRTSTNPMTQAMIQDGQITIENVQRRASAKEKGIVLDAEAEAFLADMKYTIPYAEPLASTTTTAFEVQTYDTYLFDNLNHQVSQEMHQGEQLDSDVDLAIDDDDNTIPYHEYQLNNKVESNLTDVSSIIPSGISVITILDDVRSQLVGHIKGTKFSDSRNEFSFHTFFVMNEIDGSSGEGGLVLMFSGSNMSFHQALDLIFELDETIVRCTRDILRQRDCLDWIDMVIEDLDLEPNIDAMMREFLDPFWWKKLSKEMSSKIFPGGDGSCRKTFKPIASLIAKGKLK
uniref:Reverse transcriptase domain-containing protein n=1 Tax=Tanacetum cinerariifolium TaxID=118510 RepID=A0A6L2JUT6_TANCI|nr:hypothetical protein [Tanacetum cinerariifolium]